MIRIILSWELFRCGPAWSDDCHHLRGTPKARTIPTVGALCAPTVFRLAPSVVENISGAGSLTALGS